MPEGVSVVIPNYNGVHLFKETLSTVKEALQNINLPSEIIIVDDCSTDGSVEYLHKHHPSIRVIAKEVNSGFSATANIGVFAAAFDKVLLLNSDVKLTPYYFQNQFRYFDDPDTFGVMGRTEGWNDNIIQEGARLPTFHGAKIKTSASYLLAEESQMQDGLYTFYLSGANALLDKQKFMLLNGFNELFSPFYSEDAELSIRAWRLGFKCYYDYSSVCQHQVSTSIKSKAKKEYIQTIYDRNKMFLQALHLDNGQKALWYLQLIPEALGRLLSMRWHYLKSLKMFLGAQRQVRESRKQFDEVALQVGSKRSVKEVARFIRNSITGPMVRV